VNLGFDYRSIYIDNIPEDSGAGHDWQALSLLFVFFSDNLRQVKLTLDLEFHVVDRSTMCI
jgi:hypothetical protein